jgi:hypothetical protein
MMPRTDGRGSLYALATETNMLLAVILALLLVLFSFS